MNPHQEERGKKKRKKKKNSLHSLRSFVNSFFFISPHSPKSIFYFQPNDKLLAIITCPLDFFPKFYRTFPSPCPREAVSETSRIALLPSSTYTTAFVSTWK